VIDYQLIYYELFNKIKYLAYISLLFAFILLFLGGRSDSGMIFALGAHAPHGGIQYVCTQKYTD